MSTTVKKDAAKTPKREGEPVKLLRRIGSTTVEVVIHYSNTESETLSTTTPALATIRARPSSKRRIVRRTTSPPNSSVTSSSTSSKGRAGTHRRTKRSLSIKSAKCPRSVRTKP